MGAPWPRRPRLIAGNWKMNKTAREAESTARVLMQAGAPTGTQLLVCPPFPALEAVARALEGGEILLGAQNLHPEPRGAFTGEVAGEMLTAVGCRMVIVGHSERRHGMGEDDAVVARKLRAALRDRLVPIVCVGETLAEREAGSTESVLTRQTEIDCGATAGLASLAAGPGCSRSPAGRSSAPRTLASSRGTAAAGRACRGCYPRAAAS